MDNVKSIIDQVSQWQGITVEPHRFGGQEFLLGKVEIGHIHRNGMIDIPFTRAIREQLIAENRTEHHHLLPDSGWITFYVKSPTDVENAVWLYRLSYLQKGLRRLPDQDWDTISGELNLSPELQNIVFKRQVSS